MSSLEMKYRIHEFAKDVGTKSTEIIKMLNAREEKERTHMALLTVPELDFLLDHYSKKHAVDSFDKFLASGKTEQEPAPVQEPAEETKSKDTKEGKEAAKAPVKKTEKKAEKKYAHFSMKKSSLNIISIH